MSRRHGSLSLAALLGALGLVLGACGSDAGPEAESAGTGTQRRNDAGPGTIDMVDGAAVLGTTAKACTSNVDCGTGECNPATRTCACGGQAVAATRIPANLLIVLDRSCSMVDEVAPQVTKWQAAVSALSSLMTTYEQDIRFGLTLFPDTHGANCSQGPIPFPVGANANAMRNRLQQALNEQDNLFPKGPCVTNIDTGMIQAKMDLSLRDKKHPSHVVLVTDGIQSPDCDLGGSNSGTLQAVADLKALGIGTFVVGFGSGVDVSLLDQAANAGGHARVGATRAYFEATDVSSLDAALKAIGRSTLSCELKLSSAPTNVDDMYVFFDGKTPGVPRDPSHVNGWDYDAASTTVHFYGAACESLKNGSVEKESVVMGCGAGVAPSPR